MTCHLYGHRLSQPCRAVEILLHEIDTPYCWHEIDFAANETREAWYAERVNPFATVPALVDGELHLGESHAIMRYLCRRGAAGERAARWYPAERDPARAARIDQWLDWHHANIRRHDMFHALMNLHCTLPMLKREIQNTELAPRETALCRAFALLEHRLVDTASHPTLCGEEHPSLADLSIACELYQIAAVGYRFTGYPRLERWLTGLAERPIFKAVSEAIIDQGDAIRQHNAAYLSLDTAFA